MSEKTKAIAAMAQKLRAPNFWLLIVTVAGGLLSGCSYSYVADTQSKVALHIPSKTSHSNSKTLICFKHPVPDPLHYSAFFPVVPYSDSMLLYVTPVYHWGPTIMWLPPLGSIPPRPLKPVFLLETGTQKFYVGQSKQYVGATQGKLR
jgi:hypothetical protein